MVGPPYIKHDVLATSKPFRRFCGKVGRTAQAKNRHSNGQERWPVKSAQNAESNALPKGSDVTPLIPCSWRNES
ncbi:hypothetical protein DVH24_039786 [Malus domestica]|uniref:Uncharacterized protein n=1 Tax=Malus domestica TaxID=3750 RepID=A0A498I6W1_MALDO|nr:hypothetical protein DVH24_039786 [Malus domestica]